MKPETPSYAGRDFAVTYTAGATVMRVESEAFAFLKKSLLLDAARRPAITMQDSPVLGGARWVVFNGDSTSRRNTLFTAVKPSPFQVRTKIYVFLASKAGEDAPGFVTRGSYPF